MAFFWQILEGSRQAISHTYHRILKDPRHHSAELVAFDPILQREFIKVVLIFYLSQKKAPTK